MDEPKAKHENVRTVLSHFGWQVCFFFSLYLKGKAMINQNLTIPHHTRECPTTRTDYLHTPVALHSSLAGLRTLYLQQSNIQRCVTWRPTSIVAMLHKGCLSLWGSEWRVSRNHSSYKKWRRHELIKSYANESTQNDCELPEYVTMDLMGVNLCILCLMD